MTTPRRTWLVIVLAMTGLTMVVTELEAGRGFRGRPGRLYSHGSWHRPSEVRRENENWRHARRDYYYGAPYYDSWPVWEVTVPLTDSPKQQRPKPTTMNSAETGRPVAGPHGMAIGARGPRAGTSTRMLGMRGGAGGVIRGPRGQAALATLPEDCVTFEHDEVKYYYHDYHFYTPLSFGKTVAYIATHPPVGATVADIAPNSVTMTIGGATYYADDRVYYTRAERGGVPVYTVVEPPDNGPPPETAEQGVDPYELLHGMSALLSDAPAFSFRYTDHADERMSTGVTAELGSCGTVGVRRPDRMRVEISGDRIARDAWYDGTNVTLVDHKKNEYSVVTAPPAIDDTLDLMAQQYGVALPLADLVYSDVFATLFSWTNAGYYLGEETVDGALCHHLLFAHTAVDWQIWIQANGPPLPRRVTVVYKKGHKRPRYSATLGQWNLAPQFAADDFTYEPGNATRVPIIGAPGG